MKATNYITITFPSRSANEGFARMAAAAFAAQLDPTLEELGDIKTAVSEAVTNAIVHAYPGCGIADVEQARQPLYTTGGEERSGMGFTIMESFMDTLRITSKPGQGTKVVMRRRLAQRVGKR